MSSVGIKDTQNITAVNERLIDIGNQARQLVFDLSSLFLDDIADLFAFAEISHDGNQRDHAGENRKKEKERDRKYAEKQRFYDGVCHILFGRHTHIGTFKVDLELKPLIFVQFDLGGDEIGKVSEPDIERTRFLISSFSEACNCLGYGIFGDFEYVRKDQCQTDGGNACNQNL